MITIKELLKKVSHVRYVGSDDFKIESVNTFDVNNTDEHVLMWVNEKMMSKADQLKHGVLICPQNCGNNFDTNVKIIYSENPRKSFREALETFITPREIFISEKASIAADVSIGKNVFIGHNVVIEEACTIGDDAIINHNTVILKGTIIGKNVTIGCNCTIGGVGFGYEKDIEGDYILMPHLGGVLIEDNVEIGNNTCIDRAVLGVTRLSKNVKVDNLVHIAHGAQIGVNSLIIANAMVAGSCTIGENVWVAPSSSILNKITIGSNSVIGMGAVVLKPVIEDDVVVGSPARSIKFK